MLPTAFANSSVVLCELLNLHILIQERSLRLPIYLQREYTVFFSLSSQCFLHDPNPIAAVLWASHEYSFHTPSIPNGGPECNSTFSNRGAKKYPMLRRGSRESSKEDITPHKSYAENWFERCARFMEDETMITYWLKSVNWGIHLSLRGELDSSPTLTHWCGTWWRQSCLDAGSK